MLERPLTQKMNIRDQKLHPEPTFSLYGEAISSRLLLGTAGYPSPAILASAVKASGAEIVTVSLRREAAGGKLGERFLDIIKDLGVRVSSQHGRMSNCERSNNDSPDGARAFRNRLGEARGHRQ